jgi:hypothetical protein
MTKATDYERHACARSTVNGSRVTSAQTCREGDIYRWIIRTKTATYVDGGNYPTREAAKAGLRDALYPAEVCAA